MELEHHRNLATITGPIAPANRVLFTGLADDDPVQLAFAAQLAEWVSALPADTFEPTGGEAQRQRIASKALLWQRWATLRVADGGGGFARDEQELTRLPIEVIAIAAVGFLRWLATDIEPTHPLLSRNQPETTTTGLEGSRRNTTRMRRGSCKNALKGVIAWSELYGHDGADLRGRVEPLMPQDLARPLTKVQLTVDGFGAMVDALDNEAIELGLARGIRAQAWHARQKAALLVHVWGVMRISETGLLRLERVRIRPDGTLTIRLPTSKGIGARDIDLVPRGDRFCPVAALTAWLTIAAEAGYDLNGLMLPVVRQTRIGGRVVTAPSYPTERKNFDLVAAAAGVKTPRVNVNNDLLFGTHAIRRVLPSAAGDQGKTMAFVRAIGGGAWAERSLTPAHHYMDVDDDTTQMLTELVDQIAGGSDGQS